MNKELDFSSAPYLLTEKDAALYLTRSVSSLRRARRIGLEPRFIRIGRSIRYLRSDLDAYIQALVQCGKPEARHG